MPAFGTCTKTDCSVAATGTCLLSHAKLTDCPSHLDGEAIDSPALDQTHVPATNPTPAPFNRRFHSGLELGTEDAVILMRKDYSHVIGILGSTNAGKTCFLSSLYLMISNGLVSDRYTFCRSRSLQGFEDRARLVRGWGTNLPEKLSDHTVLTDPRRPSLLHLALKAESTSAEELNLLFTDLPGEWSQKLIDRAESASSFDFLNRAEAVLIVVDATLLNSDERHVIVARTKLLIRRLAESVNLDRSIPIVLVFSKGDYVDLVEPAAATELIDYIKSFDFRAHKVMTAAFSSKPTVINGAGVVDCLDFIVQQGRRSAPALHQSKPLHRGPRMFENFLS